VIFLQQESNNAPTYLAICLSIGFSLEASAAVGKPPSLQELTQTSDLVFKGKVVDVGYKSSTPQNSSEGIPHTFVTYQISEVLTGQYSNPTITLRFVGGPTGDGGFLMVSHVPLFDVGDEDVLFVKDNTKSACPLVGCSDGRMRVINEKMYDEEGYRIVAPKNLSSFGKGKREALPSIDEHDLGGIPLRWVESTEPKSVVSTNPPQSVSAMDSLPQVSVSVFLKQVKSVPSAVSSIATIAAMPAPLSADINQALVIADSKQVATGDAQIKGASYSAVAISEDISPAERLEIERRIQETEQNQTDGSEKGIMPIF
jgi:hypothetical protein